MKPKNPYIGKYCDETEWAWNEGYAAGLRDGEERLARELRTFIKAGRWTRLPYLPNSVDYTLSRLDILRNDHGKTDYSRRN